MSSFIMESAIFQEAEILKATPKKAIFRSVIQSVDDVNQNRRMYPKQVIEEGMMACKPRMQRKAMLGELDHPFPQGNQTFDAVRQTTVSLKEVCHIIRDYEWRNNHLIGELETTSTPNGQILFGLLRDNSGIGFSLRGLAELERMKDYNLVKGPITIISYDSVSSPSHSSAIVDFNEMRFESHMVTESNGLVCCDGKCYLPDYFDKLVETKRIEFFQRWI